MPFKKGDPKPYDSGRKPGVRNKVSENLRQYVLEVADRLEAEGKGLYEFAVDHASEFWGIFARLLPKPIDLTVNPLKEIEGLSEEELERIIDDGMTEDELEARIARDHGRLAQRRGEVKALPGPDPEAAEIHREGEGQVT